MPASYSRSMLFFFCCCRLAPTFQAWEQENSLEKSKPVWVWFFFFPKHVNAETENSQTLVEVVSNNSCIFYEQLVTKAMTLQKSRRPAQSVLLYPRAGKERLPLGDKMMFCLNGHIS